MRFIYQFEETTQPGLVEFPLDEPNASLYFAIEDGESAVIIGNQAGLRYLAKLLIRMAQPGGSSQVHIHLEPDAEAAILSKSRCELMLGRNDSSKDWPDEEDYLHVEDRMANYYPDDRDCSAEMRPER